MATSEAKVDVELVADRQNHQDKLYGTDTVWFHKGDIKKVPEALWPKFAHHPDVYKLANPVLAAEADRQKALKTAAEATETLEKKLVENHATLFVTAEQLEPLPDDKIREEGARRNYKLAANLSPAKLRSKFIEAQNDDQTIIKP